MPGACLSPRPALWGPPRTPKDTLGPPGLGGKGRGQEGWGQLSPSAWLGAGEGEQESLILALLGGSLGGPWGVPAGHIQGWWQRWVRARPGSERESER